MNARQIKLALTAGLLNDPPNANLLRTIREIMTDFVHEAGTYLGFQRGIASASGPLIKEHYNLRYERATITFEVVSNISVASTAIRRLEVR